MPHLREIGRLYDQAEAAEARGHDRHARVYRECAEDLERVQLEQDRAREAASFLYDLSRER